MPTSQLVALPLQQAMNAQLVYHFANQIGMLLNEFDELFSLTIGISIIQGAVENSRSFFSAESITSLQHQSAFQCILPEFCGSDTAEQKFD